jgi:hypothetical protein
MKLDLSLLLVGLSDEQVKGVITVSWRGLLLVHILWACGWLGYIGLSGGFALADDFKSFKVQSQQRRLKDLRLELLDTKWKQCAANGEAWKGYYQTYNELRLEYKSLTGAEAPDPHCSEFR